MLGSVANEMTNSLTDWMDGWNGRRGMNQNKAMKEGRNEGVKA